MKGVPYSDVVPRLLELIPSIRPYYQKRVRELYADDLPHVIYGSILVEYLSDLESQLQEPNRDAIEATLHSAFRLLEELSSSEDFESRCLVEASVLEALFGDKDGRRRFERYLGSETQKLAQRLGY